MADNNTNEPLKLTDYHLATQKVIKPFVLKDIATALIVDKSNFPALAGVTCYTLEVWEECMRLPHWHPNAAELGYVISGTIEVLIWRSPGESAMLTLSAGMCWFIPQAALHSLNNIGKEPAKLLVGFASELPQDIDLPVAFNGIPVPIRDSITSPHNQLRGWQGTTVNPLFGKFDLKTAVRDVVTGSPYGFDLAKVTPLFKDNTLGSVIWGVKSNWNILQSIAVLRAHLKPGAARDAIWYPDAGTLYIVTKGRGQFHIILANHTPKPFTVGLYDYIFVPTGVLHTFINIGTDDFEVVAFFNKADVQPEVSLSVSTAFFPNSISRAALTQYGLEHKQADPLMGLQNKDVTPYLLKTEEILEKV